MRKKIYIVVNNFIPSGVGRSIHIARFNDRLSNILNSAFNHLKKITNINLF